MPWEFIALSTSATWGILLFAYLVFLLGSARRLWTKQEIADYYRVSRKTLAKFVHHYCPEIQDWDDFRKLRIDQIIILIKNLGSHFQGSTLSKGQLLQICETNYVALEKNVALNAKQMRMSSKAYSSMDLFPPRVSSEIIKMMG